MRVPIFAATLLVAIIPAARAQTGPAAAPAALADATPVAAMPFVAMAGSSDLYEIESSRIALTKSQKKEVRDFARMMIDHHTMTTQKVVAAAKAAGLTPPPPVLMPIQADKIVALNAAPATSFDRTYLTQQVEAHRMALALHQNYAASGDTPSLRGAAGDAVPIVQQHYDRVRQLAR